jgi:hypothetical protein
MNYRLTFITDCQRGAPQTYEGVADLNEALHRWVDDNFKPPSVTGNPDSDGPEKWIVGVVIERDNAEYTRGAVADEFGRIASLERLRASR